METKKLIDIKTSANPAQKEHEASPLIRQETTLLYYKQQTENEETKKMYSSFLSDFSIFLVKLPSSAMKKWAQIVYDRKAAYLGHQLNGTQIGLVDRVWISSGKLMGIIIDNTSIGLDPNPSDGQFNTDRIDKAVATAYHGMIRAAINLEFSAIRKDSKIGNELVAYAHRIYLRSLQLPTLDDINLAKLDYILAYSICRFVMLQTHNISVGFATDYTKENHSESAVKTLEIIGTVDVAFKQINNMREIGRLLRLLDISQDSDMKHVSMLVNKLGTLGFITLTGPADYAIAGIVLSVYVKEYGSLLIDKQSQLRLERLIEPYLKKVKFGTI